MKVPLNFGGGSGNGSDDCTATASDVLESKTAIYNGSDDEAEYGTMKDYSGTTSAGTVTNDSSNSRITLTIPNTGKYDTAAKLYNSYSNLASAVGLTAAKIATGNTIMGIAGTYTGLGSATTAQVLSGKTFSTASLSNATGTMTDKSSTSTAATSSTSDSNVRLQIPTSGYYNTSSYLTNSYSNMASTIGLTAAKIKYGETILGITGTWNGYVATSDDIYYGGHSSLLGSGTAYVASGYSAYSYVKWGTSCLELYLATSQTAGYVYEGARWANALNCGAYSSIKVTFNVTTPPSSSSTTAYIGVGLYTSIPSSSDGFNIDNATQYAESTDVYSTGSGRTVTLDISGVSADRYVGVFISISSYYSRTFGVEITRVQVS